MTNRPGAIPELCIARGWFLLPLQRRGKQPITPHGVHDASCDPTQIAAFAQRFPDCNWGVDAGRSGLLVVDLDGEEGKGSWQSRIQEHGLTRTLASHTGSGGLHIFFADPAGVARNTAGHIGPGVDTRGRGGHVVVPPSIHENGIAYRWANNAEPAAAPEWLLEVMPTRLETLERTWTVPNVDTASRYGAATLRHLLREVANSKKGSRNDTVHHAAFRVGQLRAVGLLGDDAVALLEVAAASVFSIGERPEARRTIRSGFRWGLEHPTPRDMMVARQSPAIAEGGPAL